MPTAESRAFQPNRSEDESSRKEKEENKREKKNSVEHRGENQLNDLSGLALINWRSGPQPYFTYFLLSCLLFLFD